MENETVHVLEEKEDRDDILECPFAKRFKKSDNDVPDGPSFVTTIEDSFDQDISIGDNGGDQQDKDFPSEFDGLDEAGSAPEEVGEEGSENGENCSTILV